MDETNRTTTILLAAVVVLTVIVIVLAWRDHSLARRVVDLEQRLQAVEGQPAGSRAGRAGRGSRARGGEVGAFLRGEDGAGRSGGRVRGGAASARGGDPDTEEMIGVLETPEARDLIEDVVLEQSEAEREERRLRREESMTERIHELVETFAAEHDLDEDLAGQVRDELAGSVGSMMDLRRAQYDGEISSEEAREQREQVRDATDGRLDELIGEELRLALEEAMDGGRRGPM